MYQILVHIANADPVKLDVEELPSPADNCVVGRNPRERNDKEFNWLDEGVTMIIFPWHRINFIQVLPSREEEKEFITFFREDR